MMMPNEYEEAFSAFLEQKESNYAPHAILMMAVRQHPTDTVPPYILHCTRRGDDSVRPLLRFSVAFMFVLVGADALIGSYHTTTSLKSQSEC